jgi:uncharacterized protein YfbU (UPF0304 family)
MEAAMPTITLRLDDATKEELEALARSRGQSLSDLIRSALDGLLMRNKDEDRLDITPRSLTAVERQQLALLHRILARVVGDDNDVDGDKAYQLERAQVLEEGFVGEYSMEFCGISSELSARDSKFVVDVLDLFRIVTFSIMKLEADGVEFGEDLARALRFDGFDSNDAREGHMLAYARHLVNDERWAELLYTFSAENDRGNSHARRADVYRRMLDEHAKIEAERRHGRVRHDAYLLGIDELKHLADAQIHPDNRR